MIRKYSYVIELHQYSFFFFRHIVSDESRLFALSLVKRNQHRQLIDFDNHFDSISNDWRNLNISNELQKSSF